MVSTEHPSCRLPLSLPCQTAPACGFPASLCGERSDSEEEEGAFQMGDPEA